MLRLWVTALGGVALLAHAGQAQRPAPSHSTYVIVHGAWGGSWDWHLVDSLLTSRGHHVYRPSLTGLGERVHLASPTIGLATHVEDVVNTILWEDLRDIILVGHSYGGMVIAGVADRLPERIRRLVYLDAFLPDSGERTLDLADSIGVTYIRANIRDGFIVPPWVKEHDAIPRDVPQPLRTFTDTLRLLNPTARKVPGVYILTVEPGKEPDQFQRFADRAATRGWPVRRLTADHVPERSAPLALVNILIEVR